MPLLTDADAIFLNGSEVKTVYLNGQRYDVGAETRYFTRIDSSTKGFELSSVISIPSAPMAYRLKMAFVGSVSARIRPIDSVTQIEFDAFSGNAEFFYRNGGVSYSLATLEGDYDDGSLVEYILQYDGTNVEGFINGVSVGSAARPDGGFDINDIFPDGVSSSNVYYPQSLEIWFDTNDTNTSPDWNCQFDSDGTGSTETDIVGGNNLTRIGLTSADTELFTFDEYLNVWKNKDESVLLPVTY